MFIDMMVEQETGRLLSREKTLGRWRHGTLLQGRHRCPFGPYFKVALNTRTSSTTYPEPFASRMVGREKRPLGDIFELSNFGVNLTRLIPGACSALRHAHSKQDEFVYILVGCPVLITDQGETLLSPGMCAGFKAGTGNGHQLVNRANEDVLYLEVGDRTAGDSATYPDDDLQAALDNDGEWQFLHKNGTPY
ncbi:cupin domain-containing protein [Ferrovum myxofaciens]|nr:cupin domain-containing protein [Ferrovum myxofaciens]MBU6995917.1 cupin domain-containing protein [Ferrovum myxofaciens]